MLIFQNEMQLDKCSCQDGKHELHSFCLSHLKLNETCFARSTFAKILHTIGKNIKVIQLTSQPQAMMLKKEKWQPPTERDTKGKEQSLERYEKPVCTGKRGGQDSHEHLSNAEGRNLLKQMCLNLDCQGQIRETHRTQKKTSLNV